MTSDSPEESGGAPRQRKSTVASRRVYEGRVLNLDVDQVRFPDGTVGELELIRHSGAAAVVPFLDDPNEPGARILLIRQFRYAADGFLYEFCCRIQATRRCGCGGANLEETDARLSHSLPGGFFTTPGFIDEYIHVFIVNWVARRRYARAPRVHSSRVTYSGRRIAYDRWETVDEDDHRAVLADRLSASENALVP
jgi:hypothetical protein